MQISGGVQLRGPVTLGPGAGAAPTPGAENFGYSMGGRTPAGNANMIQKYSYTSDGNATDVGDLPRNTQQTRGASSATNGYTMGGYTPSVGDEITDISKFAFTSDGNASDVSDLALKIRMQAPASSTTNGYSAGGYSSVTFPPSIADRTMIQKFEFATDSDASDIGDLTVSRFNMAGSQSSTHGYAAGGDTNPGETNVIDKYPFASDGNATDVGDLSTSNARTTGTFSNTHGYANGGVGPLKTYIEKWSFASDGNSTKSADLFDGTEGGSGSSSKTYGYVAGGEQADYKTIQKYPFASDDDSTDVGDLIGTHSNNAAGAQY